MACFHQHLFEKDFSQEMRIWVENLHKERRAGRDCGFYLRKRISRGRGSDVDLQKRCMGCCLNVILPSDEVAGWTSYGSIKKVGEVDFQTPSRLKNI